MLSYSITRRAAILIAAGVFAGGHARAAATVSNVGGVFPQIVDGGGWQTTITIVNMDAKDAPFTLTFSDESGNRLPLSIAGVGVTSQISGTLPVKSSRVIQTSGGAPTVSVGWAYLGTSNYVSGQAVFRQSVPGRPDFEAGGPIAGQFDNRFVLQFDNLEHTTSIALVNPNSSSRSTVTAAIYDENGSRILLDLFTLDINQHVAFALPSQWPQTAGHRGTIEFIATGSLSALGLQFNDSGPFTFVQTVTSALRP